MPGLLDDYSQAQPPAQPQYGPSDLLRFLGMTAAPNLTSLLTGQPTAPIANFPSEPGKVPSVDPRMMGAAFELPGLIPGPGELAGLGVAGAKAMAPAALRFWLPETARAGEAAAPGIGRAMGAEITPAARAGAAGDIIPGSQAWRDMPNPNAPFPQYAEQYPPVGPPVMKLKDKPSFEGETYPAKQATPEADAFMKARQKIMKDMDEKGFHPYFDPQQRFDVDPANYPMNLNTESVVPKDPAKLLEHLQRTGASETRAQLQKMYEKGVELGKSDVPGGRLSTQDWYQMGQLENALTQRMGPEAGREAFKNNFAFPMAQTTGGMDPRSNLIAAGYENFLRGQGQAFPTQAFNWPVPVGARYGEQLANTVNKLREGGFEGLGEANPKRHDFAADFMGHQRPVMDEQMSGVLHPAGSLSASGKVLAKAQGTPDWYGVDARIAAEEGAKIGVDPRKFQETVWHGTKDTSGQPMIQTVNEAIERTHRLTGMPRSEIVQRAWGAGNIPVYGMAGLLGLGATQRSQQQE